jgi:hypothetical protein
MDRPAVLRNPGKVLEEALLAKEPHERPAMLERVERGARQEGDLEVLRAIKQYREMSRQLGPLKEP